MAEVRRKGDLDNMGPKLENGVKAGLLLAGQLVAQRAQLLAPIDTGRLKRSLTTGEPRKVRGTAWGIDIGTNVEYAAIHEFGGKTGPHVIEAKNAQALMFQMGGQTVFFKKVNHPGSLIPAQPYLRPALKQSKSEVRTIIVRSVIGALKR